MYASPHNATLRGHPGEQYNKSTYRGFVYVTYFAGFHDVRSM